MAGQLFRQEALAHQVERHWGRCMALTPVSLSVLTWLLFAVVFATGVVLVAGSYQRKSVVSGILVADQGTLQVRAPVAGIVEEVATGTGERVGKGELLVRLRSGMEAGDGQAVTSRLLAENRKQEQLLDRLRQDKEAEYALRRMQLSDERSRLQQRSRHLDALVANEEAVLGILTEHHVRLTTLVARALAATSERDKARMDLLKQESVVRQARLELADTQQALAALAQDAALLKLERARDLADLERNLSELHKQDVQLQAEQGAGLSAPVSGMVTDLLVAAGATVAAGQSMVSLVPEDSVLEAELHVPSRAIGFLQEGTLVNLRLDAFPYQKFGMQRARIREIASTPVVPAGTEAQRIAEPYYRVMAMLDSQALQMRGAHYALRPGMQFQADLVLETRSLLEWLLEPLLRRGWPAQ